MQTIDWNQVAIIFVYSLLTAIACGLGAIPFFFLKNISKQGIGIAKSIAAWLMIAASFGMINEWLNHGVRWIFFGILIGMAIVMGAKVLVHKHEWHITFGNTKGKTAGELLLFLAIMTVHSGTEGIAMGFAFGPSWKLWLLVALVMAIQNIPEWLAIASVMVPKGISPWKAVRWSIFSSLPQPLVAVPAFLFVSAFQPLLPWGLGFAAGAMLWMSFSELLPEAIENTPSEYIATIATISIACMVLLEHLLG
jgi:ZIP family zinc transporter